MIRQSMHFTLYNYMSESLSDREEKRKKRKLVTTSDTAVMTQFTRMCYNYINFVSTYLSRLV